MKLLLLLIVLILNLKNINGEDQVFANFIGSYQEGCSGNVDGNGFTLVIGKCVSIFGIMQQNLPFPTTTNWLLSLDDSKTTLSVHQFDEDDNHCKGSPIKSLNYTNTPDQCIEMPPFLFSNNSLTSADPSYKYAKLSFGTNKPLFASNAVVFSFYDSGNTINCNWGNQQFSITYASGLKIYENSNLSITVLCNQVAQPMEEKCDPQGKCHSYFIDTVCQQSGDIAIYCTQP